MAKASSQKFIARNRAPRVQVEYDVELYGAEKKVNLPFVMGVMADLSGKPEDPLAPVAERKFLEIDVDNFDERLKSSKPRVAFQVPNTLTGEGNLSLDLTFESMDDFSPAAVARKVDSLNKLLTAREQLSNLLAYMDGKSDAEELIAKALKDPSLLAKPGALVTKIVKIITDNALKAFGDTTALGDLKQLAQDIVNNLKAAKACFVINIPGQPPKIQHVGHLGDLQSAAWLPASQVR